MLRVAGLAVSYGADDVLHDIELDVPEGQLLCVLGPSGGGKSTLLRAIAGLEVPRAGSIHLDGRDLAGVPAHQRGIGLMFQDYALFPHRDVGQNVAFGLRMRGTDPAAMRVRVHELLDLVGLPGTERRSVAQLSGGEQQRVALARALAPRPHLLMLDEPMGSLDRALRERLPGELRGIFAGLGLTILYVTHDQDEALSVADRVVILDTGRLVADGSPEELWSHPPSEWVARFLGFHNVAPARIVAAGVETPWGTLPPHALDRAPVAGQGMVGDGTTVLLRPAGLVAEEGGPIQGIVGSRRFGGDHVLFTVEVAGAPALEVEARGGELPAVGQVVALTPLPGSACLLGRDHGGRPVHVVDSKALPSGP